MRSLLGWVLALAPVLSLGCADSSGAVAIRTGNGLEIVGARAVFQIADRFPLPARCADLTFTLASITVPAAWAEGHSIALSNSILAQISSEPNEEKYWGRTGTGREVSSIPKIAAIRLPRRDHDLFAPVPLGSISQEWRRWELNPLPVCAGIAFSLTRGQCWGLAAGSIKPQSLVVQNSPDSAKIAVVPFQRVTVDARRNAATANVYRLGSLFETPFSRCKQREVYIMHVIGQLGRGRRSEPGRLSFVLSPKGSRTGPDFGNPAETAFAPIAFKVFGAGLATSGFPGKTQPDLGSGDRIRTYDLQVMSLTSCLCSTPHEDFIPQFTAHPEAPDLTTFRRTNL